MRFGAEIIHFYVESGVSGCGKHRGKQEIRRITQDVYKRQVQTGYKYAWENGYDMAVQVDGDGQHDPEFLELMAEYLELHQVDMVIGSRFIEKQGFQSSGMRRVGIRFFYGLIRLMTGKTITDPTSGLRMAGRNAVSYTHLKR